MFCYYVFFSWFWTIMKSCSCGYTSKTKNNFRRDPKLCHFFFLSRRAVTYYLAGKRGHRLLFVKNAGRDGGFFFQILEGPIKYNIYNY